MPWIEEKGDEDDVFLIINATQFVFDNIKIIDKDNTVINKRLNALYKDYFDLDYDSKVQPDPKLVLARLREKFKK